MSTSQNPVEREVHEQESSPLEVIDGDDSAAGEHEEELAIDEVESAPDDSEGDSAPDDSEVESAPYDSEVEYAPEDSEK